MTFANRSEAGRRLAGLLAHLESEQVVVLGLPRGGVPVAYEVARALGAPLDVIVVRKLGVPSQPELAMGAIGEHGVRVLNEAVLAEAGVPAEVLEAVEMRERHELERRGARFRGSRAHVQLEGRVAVIVDDGIATGSTARAACEVVRALGASRVVLAAPVAPTHWAERLGGAADEYVCVATPAHLFAIGEYYEDFSETPDEEVIACIERAARAEQVRGGPRPAGEAKGSLQDQPRATSGRTAVKVPVTGAVLRGELAVPEGAAALVIFAHGSGSSRHSPRNQYVASVLEEAGLATLLIDLLAPGEEHRANVFDIGLLARRLVGISNWTRDRRGTGDLALCYFGASTGAAAALAAAADLKGAVAAVVSRGGRPDLAMAHLPEVVAPTLLIVGGRDAEVLRWNEAAATALICEHRLDVVPGATHLFEEPGALEQVARLACDWFSSHLRAPAR